ncbi:chitinase [Streptomyces abyssalis]|uniref:Chitinase n=1 Tax=Streptomyces abyssalis TaxID=933944 RepID=A0A1E7JLX5_9ACTN|nr:chitinase [Streptomyces abyssalis]OEU91275.1 chitinase [Streptomyces abyssalis]
MSGAGRTGTERGTGRSRPAGHLVRAGGVLALALATLGTAAPAAPAPADPAAPATADPTTPATAAPATRAAPLPPAPMAVAPYLSLGWGDAPEPAEVMAATGVRWFSLAFVLSRGTCEPRWDGRRPLSGGVDDRTVRAVRAAGGDVIPSFGGGLGHKLEQSCADAQSLAAAYQKVIDAYSLKAIDIDIEMSAYRSKEAQRKTLAALSRVKKANPGLVTYITLPSYRSGPDRSLIDRAAEMGVEPDAWSIMPFSFVPSAKGEDMGRISTRAVDGLKDRLMNAYGYSETEAYAHSGISSMNGITGEGETITVEDFRTIAAHARKHGLSRLTFWSVNRDRPCGARPYPAEDSCSGVAQKPWQYTKTLAQHGR